MASVSNPRRVFADPDYVLREDRMDEGGEMRWHAMGLVDAVLLLVVHVYRSAIDGEEIIRIISARKARKPEGRGYFQ
ncbi:MAG: BrnT family toxin [Bryobacteraceae bacterium]